MALRTAGQQPALDQGGHGVLTDVAPGVVDAEGGVRGQLDGEPAVVRVERRGRPRAVEADQPERRVAQGQRHHQQRMAPRRAHRLRARGVDGQPRVGRAQRNHPGPQIGQCLAEGRGGGQAAYVTHGTRLPRTVLAAAESGAHQGSVRRQRGEGRFVAAEHGVHHLHDRHVGELGHHGPDEFLTAHRGVQGAAHAPAYRLQHPGAGAAPLPFADVDRGDRQAQYPSARTRQAQGGDLEVPLLGRLPLEACPHDAPAQGVPALQHVPQQDLHLVVLDDPERVAERTPDQIIRGQVPHGRHGGVEPDHPQFGVQQMQTDRRTAEQGLQQGVRHLVHGPAGIATGQWAPPSARLRARPGTRLPTRTGGRSSSVLRLRGARTRRTRAAGSDARRQKQRTLSATRARAGTLRS